MTGGVARENYRRTTVINYSRIRRHREYCNYTPAYLIGRQTPCQLPSTASNLDAPLYMLMLPDNAALEAADS